MLAMVLASSRWQECRVQEQSGRREVPIITLDIVMASSVMILRKIISGCERWSSMWRIAGRVWVSMSLVAVMASVPEMEVGQELGLSAVSGVKVATFGEL